MSYGGATRGSGGKGSAVLMGNNQPPPTTTKKTTQLCFLIKVKYTRFLFKHRTPISCSHLSLHIRSSCSLETKGGEIRQLLARVVEEAALHEASGEELCSWGVFSGLGQGLPLALGTGDGTRAFCWQSRLCQLQ